MEHTRCLIIGSGPAGYTAAIYAGRANLQPVEYCGMQAGGQLTQTTIVDNFPGYPNGVDGNQMMMELREQAGRFGVDMRDGEIIKADFSQKPYVFTTDRGVGISADRLLRLEQRLNISDFLTNRSIWGKESVPVPHAMASSIVRKLWLLWVEATRHVRKLTISLAFVQRSI